MKRHSLDGLSLAFGLLFTLIGFWLLTPGADVTDLDGRWVLPLGAIFAGSLLAVAAVSMRRDDESSPEAPQASQDQETS